MSFTDFIVGNLEAGVGAVTGNPALVAAGTAKSGGAIVGAATAGNAKDATRLAQAQAALPKAIAGSLSDAQFILQQRFHSATAYGKSVYEGAWNTLVQQNPAIAAEALKTGQASDPLNTDPSIRSRLADEWNRLTAAIRQDIGTAVQRVGSGVTTGAAQAIDPNTSRVTLPIIGGSTMWMIAIVALAIAAVVLLTRKKA